MNMYNIDLPNDLLSENISRKAYMMRINTYNDDVRSFLYDYFQTVIKNGAFLEKGFRPVTPDDIEYFEAQCRSFRMDRSFIKNTVRSCLSSSDAVYESLSNSIYLSLSELKQQGKNDSILKNIFIKFMCWLKKDISRALTRMETKTYPPKIICKGDLSRHEFMMLSAAANAGCDVLIVEYSGSDYYKKADPSGSAAMLLSIKNGGPFPADFSLSVLKKMQKPVPSNTISQQTAENTAKPAVQTPVQVSEAIHTSSSQSSYEHCVNAWISGDIFADIKTPHKDRSSNANTICTVYARINGVENKNTYLSDLYNFYMSVKDTKNPLIIDQPVENPSNAEINAVQRGNYRTSSDLINDMAAKNIIHSNGNMQTLIRDAFMWAMTDYAQIHHEIRKVMTRAVYVISWFKRYQHDLFGDRSPLDPGCLIIYGGCKSDTETTFVKMIARCPCDVIILCPDLTTDRVLADDMLYERNFTESCSSDSFPREGSNVQIGTVAYYANQELENIMYNDSGMYKSYQYSKASTLILKTIYEEIPIMWEAGLQFRPGFNAADGKVTMPVIMSKISGVKDSNFARYWNEIHDLLVMHSAETIVFKNQTLILNSQTPCDYASAFVKNGQLDRNMIKTSRFYNYGHLKEEVQDYILDTLDLFLRMKIVKDQDVNGYIYRIIHIALNISGYILRLIQGFDFTTINPKIIYVYTLEHAMPRDDSVLLAFLNKLGFDIVMYIPSGYQSAEKYLLNGAVNCIEAGPYKFGLRIPDLNHRQIDKSKSLISQIFARK